MMEGEKINEEPSYCAQASFTCAANFLLCLCIILAGAGGGWGAVQCGGTVVVVGMIVMIGDNLGNLSP